MGYLTVDQLHPLFIFQLLLLTIHNNTQDLNESYFGLWHIAYDSISTLFTEFSFPDSISTLFTEFSFPVVCLRCVGSD